MGRTVGEPDWGNLVEVIRRAGQHLDVRAVLVAGSWARDEADRASDVDLLAITDRGPSFVQVGRLDGWFVEVLYARRSDLDPSARPPTRATFRGARVLFDSDGRTSAWLGALEQFLSTHTPPGSALLPYHRWDLRHTVQAMRALAEAEDLDALLVLRNRLVEELMAYLYLEAGVWPPSLRRQFTELERIRPGIHPLLRAVLRAAPDEIMGASEGALAAVVGSPSAPDDFREAPLLPLS